MTGLKFLRKTIIIITLALAGSGHAFAAAYTDTEKANIKLVLDFYAALDQANADGTMRQQARSIAERFVSPDYIQHSEMYHGGNARQAFIDQAEHAPAGPVPPAMKIPAKTVSVMADGDKVILVTSRDVPDGTGGTRPTFIFNMFRIAAGRLAEHWDALPDALTGKKPAPPGGKP